MTAMKEPLKKTPDLHAWRRGLFAFRHLARVLPTCCSPSGEKGTAMSNVKLAIVAALLGLASTTTAWADAKYKRNQDVKVTVNLSDRVKPVTPKTQGTSEFKPELNADQVLSIEGLVGTIRQEQEQILGDLIAQTPDTEVEEKSDYYF